MRKIEDGQRSCGQPVWLRGLTLCTFLSAFFASQISAQVIPYPQDGLTPSRPTLLSGVGAGAERPASVAPGSRFEFTDGQAIVSRDLPAASTSFLEWDRWWHGQLYGVLADRRWNNHNMASLSVDPLVKHEVLGLLRERFEAGSVSERSAAAIALARLGRSSVSNDLIFALESAPQEVQSAILLAFGMSGAEEARSLLSSIALDGRFGRRALGKPRQPVPTAIRSVALVASGMLPATKTDQTLHTFLKSKENISVELMRAAFFGLSQHVAQSSEMSPRARRYGRSLAAWNLGVEHQTFYLALLSQDDLDDTCKSLLLLSLAKALPASEILTNKVIELLNGDNAVLARSAAVASAELTPEDRSELTGALWGRVKKGGDAATTGFVLMSIAGLANPENFEALLAHQSKDATTKPYLAFALLKAAANQPKRQAAAKKRIRELIDSSLKGDSIGLSGLCVAAALLSDHELVPRLSRIHQNHATMTSRSAAGLALGILGEGDKIQTKWLEQVRRANVFQVHDSALGLAFSNKSSAVSTLVQAMNERRDGYSLGGIAQSLGLMKNTRAIPALAKLIENEKSSNEARTFAIGALGLILEKTPGAWSNRLRSLTPVPIESPVLKSILTHL